VDILTGYSISNAQDIRAMPQGQQDNTGAQIMSWFLKYAQDETGAGDLLHEVFEDGNIRGMDAMEVGVDYTGDKPVNGEIVVNRLTPGWGPGRDVIWDPYWTKYDLSDARYILKYKHAFLVDLIAEYPEHETE